MGENIIAVVVVILVCIIMMGIGILQIKSKAPVGFYSGEKPLREVGCNRRFEVSGGIKWYLRQIDSY